MRCEQTSSWSLWPSDPATKVQVRMTVEVEIPGEEGVDTSISLGYKPSLPEHVSLALRQGLYDGVHGGFAATGLPLPREGIRVTIPALSVDPWPDERIAEVEVQRLADLLQALTCGMVAASWLGLEALRSRASS